MKLLTYQALRNVPHPSDLYNELDRYGYLATIRLVVRRTVLGQLLRGHLKQKASHET